jgi:RHS repeat-associated protein
LLYIDSNIGSDADANAMTYGSGGAGVHGLKQGYYGGVVHTFNYDAVGNVTSINAATGNATFAYDAQNRATSLSKGVTTQTFAYEPNGQRFYQYQSSTNEHTFYLYGGVYQDTRIGAAGTGYRKTQVTDAVQHTKDPTGVEQYLYFRRDGLGSIDAILNSAGGVVDTLGYDPYGSRRMSDWSADINSTELNEILNNANMRTKRGFTDHEHLDLVDVVHMNGRIYDPRFGRFLNADPIVVDPFNSQAHNRYAYVRGSPLSRTDPSGFAEDDPIEEVVVEGRRAPDDPRWNIDHGADLSPESLSASVGGIVYTPFFWIQGADGTPGVIVYGKKPAQPSGNPFAHPVGGLAVAEVDSYPIRVNPATGCYVWDGQCAAFKQVGGGGGEVKQFLQSCSGEVATCVAQKVGEATAVGMVIGLPTKGVEKLSESLAKDNFSTSIRKIRGMSKLVAPISTGATVIQLPVFYQYCTLMSPACSEGGAHD